MSDLAFERGAGAVNALGIELYGALAAGQRNFVISPLSIQLALSMTFVGAAGQTADEMQRVLRLGDGAYEELVRLARSLAASQVDDLHFDLANRLFVQRGVDLRPAFLERVAKDYGATPETLDFSNAEASRREINAWVSRATHDKIRELVPPGVLDDATRLVLANALYLRAAWAHRFHAYATHDDDFFVDGAPVKVPTMTSNVMCGHVAAHGAQVVTLPFVSGALQFVAIVPKHRDGLDDVDHLATWLDLAAHLSPKVIVRMPKFRIEPDALALSKTLRGLGLATAFDHPPGSANFEAMAPRTPDDYLCIGDVLHKTFFALDEEGVEAAAATAVVMMAGGASRKPPPVIRIDRPFIFAVQHAASGACLFLGRVTDPRG